MILILSATDTLDFCITRLNIGCKFYLVDMDNIPLIVHHSGYWDEDMNRKNFKIFGVLLPNNCNFNYLVGTICNELKLQPRLTFLIIEYQAKDGYPLFTIVDDNHLLFYIELKKREPDFSKYHLSLTVKVSYMQTSSNSNQSETTVDNGCVQAQITKGVSSNVTINLLMI